MAAALDVLIRQLPKGPDDPPLSWERIEAELRALTVAPGQVEVRLAS